MMRTFHHPFRTTAALLCAGFTGAALAGAGERPDRPTIPPALRAVPADPRPGTILPATGATTAWAVLQSLDGEAGFGLARTEDGTPLAFRLLPYASLWRFGAPGAAAGEFPAGLRVRLSLLPMPGAPPGATPVYAAAVADEITEQLAAGGSYRLVSQEIPERQFTAEWTAAATNEGAAANGNPGPPPDAQRLTLGYGPKTVLVRGAEPIYTFRVAAGTPLRINSGYPAGATTRMAMEVLDEAGAVRFRDQQRLRLQARAEVKGAPGYLRSNGAGGATVLLFPEYLEWTEGLRPGDALLVAAAGATETAAVLAARAAKETATSPPGLILRSPLPGVQPDERVVVRRAPRPVEFARDIRPLLAVNCLPCHGGAGARGGYSIESPERLRRGGPRGPGIVAGKSGESLLYLLMTGDRNPPMPLDRPAIPEQLALIKRWIDAGAPAGNPTAP
jgi:hypothetical protein